MPTVNVVTTQPLATAEPWSLIGISKSSWNRLRSKGQTPLPVNLIAGRPLWRIADLKDWLERQPAHKGRSTRGGRHEKPEE